MSDSRSARGRRDVFMAMLGGPAFGMTYAASTGFNVVLGAIGGFVFAFLAIKLARLVGVYKANDLAFEQDEIPETLPTGRRNALIMKQFLQRQEAQESDAWRLIVFSVAAVLVVLALASAAKLAIALWSVARFDCGLAC